MTSSSLTRRRIEQAAMELFAHRGIEALNVSELAQTANMARGTVYNNIDAPEKLLESIAARLGIEMHERVVASYAETDDAAVKLAIGIRQFVRRAHDEPSWGRFVVRFSFNHESSDGMLANAPADDLLAGLKAGRYSFDTDEFMAVISMISGTTLASMFSVLEGYVAWRDAGQSAAALVLRGLGVEAREARTISCAPLPLLRVPKRTD